MNYSWLTNLLLGLFGFLLVFLLSVNTNTIETSILRGFVSFLGFYLFGFIFTWVIAYVFSDNNNYDKDTKHQINKQGNKATGNDTTSTTNNVTEMQSDKSPTFEGDVYERTSEYVRDLLKEED